MADTDGVLLQKRGDDEGKKKQAKSKSSSCSNAGKGKACLHKGNSLRMVPDSSSSSSDGAEEGSTNLTMPIFSIRNGGAYGWKGRCLHKVDSDQEELALSMLLENSHQTH
ncbi:hypothetical protein BASA61_008985 [Batrachochytrium salamandrivorans]|nr:hypothetical protein BASA61_008985 [Batrachochytrium salamandrivorans]